MTNAPLELITENDNIVIVNYIDGIRGGRSLDVSGYADPVLKAGLVIIRETATDTYKPMPITGNAYAALPAGHTYVGILAASIRKERPLAGILTFGVVNPEAAPIPYTPILTALKTALPQVQFLAD